MFPARRIVNGARSRRSKYVSPHLLGVVCIPISCAAALTMTGCEVADMAWGQLKAKHEKPMSRQGCRTNSRCGTIISTSMTADKGTILPPSCFAHVYQGRCSGHRHRTYIFRIECWNIGKGYSKLHSADCRLIRFSLRI